MLPEAARATPRREVGISCTAPTPSPPDLTHARNDTRLPTAVAHTPNQRAPRLSEDAGGCGTNSNGQPSDCSWGPSNGFKIRLMAVCSGNVLVQDPKGGGGGGGPARVSMCVF